jgi:2-polyprenyl-3-methyl-5-hydroxy-6-metoxy-1,4-benzoquinol methylase
MSLDSPCGCCGRISSRTPAFFKPKDSQFTVNAGQAGCDTPGWHLSYCDSCSVLSVDPVPSESELNKIYEGDFYSSNIYRGGIGDWMMQKPLDTQESKDHGLLKKLKRARMQRQDLAYVRKMAEPLKASAERIRFLDIGCGTGETLTAAAALEWEASGIELNPLAAAIARARSGRPVFNGPFEDFTGIEKQYDIIHVGDVLEHLREPNRLIAWAEGKLVPGGILRVQVPNDLAGYRMRWFSKIWWMFPPVHLHYFTPASLSALLERHGFSIVSKGSVGESVGIDTRRYVLWSSGMLSRADALATTGGLGALPLELVRLLWDRILSVPLQVIVGRTMRGFVFWMNAQKSERAPE